MKIELRTPSRSDRHLLRPMMQLYLYDFSEYEDTDLDEHGYFNFDDLDYYWFEHTHSAFLATVGGKLAGFVLTDNKVFLEGSERSITEFFVMRKYRRRGVGDYIANEIFNQLPSAWDIAVMENNAPALQFWRKVIAQYTHGIFRETWLDNHRWTGPVFSFDNRPHPASG